MPLKVVGNPFSAVFWVLIVVCAGMIARPIIHWAFDQLTKMLEELEPSEREGADLELYRACGMLESLNGFAWVVCGPFLLPIAIWSVWIVLEGKIMNRKGKRCEGVLVDRQSPYTAKYLPSRTRYF